ncbi:hypothetical protein TUM17384_13650 [Shewanella algae]|uniref:hypothetical protein n=1 Tax=Shewanella algae TaxID=38313 RepID=UPI001BF10C28|nr:hypothetical protein [Shewanella algae]BCV57420.1 hypothetical protein TUM17384_13650 [Shewanella algae]
MQDKGKSNSIETLNLLISIKTNFEDYPVADNDLLHLFDLHKHVDERGSEYIKKQESCDIGYFQMMVLSGIIENKKPLITNFIENEIYQKISKEMAMEFKRNTELSCMFFDSMSNPYFSQTFKEKLFSDVFQKLFSKAPDNTSVLEYLSSKEWFFTWKKDNLAQILMKKELRNPY